VQVLCDAPNGRGGTWNRDGVIVFTSDSLIGLYRVSAMGGSPVEITKLDTARLEQSHRWPVFLPDGKHFLYMAANFNRQTGVNAIFLGSIDSQEKRQIVSTNANAAYAEPGYLVYLRDKTLVAQPFDSEKYVLSGDPHPLSDQVLYFAHVGRAIFSASAMALHSSLAPGYPSQGITCASRKCARAAGPQWISLIRAVLQFSVPTWVVRPH